MKVLDCIRNTPNALSLYFTGMKRKRNRKKHKKYLASHLSRKKRIEILASVCKEEKRELTIMDEIDRLDDGLCLVYNSLRMGGSMCHFNCTCDEGWFGHDGMGLKILNFQKDDYIDTIRSVTEKWLDEFFRTQIIYVDAEDTDNPALLQQRVDNFINNFIDSFKGQCLLIDILKKCIGPFEWDCSGFGVIQTPGGREAIISFEHIKLIKKGYWHICFKTVAAIQEIQNLLRNKLAFNIVEYRNGDKVTEFNISNVEQLFKITVPL